MPSVGVSSQDRKWEAESDFRSLVEAEQVRTDAKRHRRAKTAGRRMVREETKALKTKRSLVRAPRRR